jgi:outer membrane receptor protein involved in Fe transport
MQRGNQQTWIAAMLAVIVACPPAQALVALNDGRDRIYVNGSVTVAHDSNVFASNGSEGDFVYSSSLAVEYTRRAGWIGVNANASVTSSRFANIDGQDFANPSISLELVKQSGRTTGSVTLNAVRQSRADAAVNARIESWNYNTGLGVKYPVSGSISLAGNFGYSDTIYVNNPGGNYADLAAITAALDVFHVLTSDRDVFGGYRYRHGETSRSVSYTDHSFSAGISGKVIRGVKGTLRAGFQVRVPGGASTSTETFTSWTSGGSLTYAFNKLTNVSFSISKDFSTTATESFVDTLTLQLDVQRAFTSKFGVTAGAGYGDNRFLGQGSRAILDPGPPPVLGPERRDSYITWNVAMNYSMNEHLKMAASYSWFQNFSSSEFADFVRSGYSLTVSSRW